MESLGLTQLTADSLADRGKSLVGNNPGLFDIEFDEKYFLTKPWGIEYEHHDVPAILSKDSLRLDLS